MTTTIAGGTRVSPLDVARVAAEWATAAESQLRCLVANREDVAAVWDTLRREAAEELAALLGVDPADLAATLGGVGSELDNMLAAVTS